MAYPKILIKAGREHVLSHMHPWIFSNALEEKTVQKIEAGAVVDIYGADGKKFYARGYYNPHSQIAVRILTRDSHENIDRDFFAARFTELLKIRERFIDTRTTNAFRVVFGESDGIPGLIIDKYADVFVLQIHTLGMEMLRNEIVAAMKKAFNPSTIYERSDVGVRQQEGLTDMPARHLEGKKIPDEIEIMENGVHFLVNIKEGQKTGFFLDQRENRKTLQKYVKGARVLNCFSYTAGFSVYSALAGASETVSVDVSAQALETAKRNFTRNNLPLNKHRFIAKDVFEVLSDCLQKKERFEVIILDPPAFVKNQKSLKKGLSGYLFINEQALRLLPKGGILVSSSCSAHVTDEMFQKTLALAASRSGSVLKTLEIKHQPIDHPFNPQFPEGKYLKFYVMLKA